VVIDLVALAAARASHYCRCSLEHSARHLLGKCEADRLLADAATAVLQQCAQLGSHERRNRLGREAVAALQSMEQAVANSISRCDQGAMNELLRQSQVEGGQDFCVLVSGCTHYPLQESVKRLVQR
jgi:glutamate racemase